MISYPQPDNVSVLIVDDHELTRFTLKLALSTQQDLQIVGLASNGQEAVEMVERYHPDLIVLDLQMPVMDGLSAAKQIKAIDPNTNIIAYSSLEVHNAEVMIQNEPIDAFCKKDTPTEVLIQLVKKLGRQAVKSP